MLLSGKRWSPKKTKGEPFKKVDIDSTGNTKNMRFVPLREDDVTPVEMLKKLVMVQNKYIEEISSIQLFNIGGIDWQMPSNDISFRAQLLGDRHKSDKEFLISSIERVG